MRPRRQPGALGWARSCYAAVLSDGALTVVRGTRSGRAVRCAPVDPADPAFREAVARGRTFVAGCLMERESFTRWITAPLASESKALKVLPSLLDNQLPFRLDECVYRFLPAPSAEDGTVRALAVAARADELEKKLAAYREGGGEPAALDQEGLALWTQSLLERPAAAGVTRLVVAVYAKQATLVLGRDGEPTGAHAVPLGVGPIERVLRARLGDSPGPVEWAWAGPGAEGEDFEALRTRLQTSWPGEAFVHGDPGSFLARGVATRALTAGPYRCDLRSEASPHPVLLARAARRTQNALLAVFLAGVILSAAAVAAGSTATRRLEEARRTLSERIDRLAGYHVTTRGDQALKELERALKEQSKGTRPFLDALAPSLSETLAAVLKSGAENGLAYDLLFLRPDSVMITGTCAAWNECEKLSARLKNLGYSVRLDRRESSADGRIHFTILPGGGGA